MKAKILLLMIFSGLILDCCRSKTKITTVSQENKQETEKVQVDSSGLQSVESAQSASANISLKEKTDNLSGDVLIKGKSDTANPFIFHNVIGNDTVQSISILGNAEYSVSNRYTKASNEKSENKKEEITNIFQERAQSAVSKESDKTVTSVISEETKKLKVTGFEIAAWICITILGITLILIFFTYKYLKK